ncbi:MAG: hypothetical protein LBU55_02705 [Elusimicrobiota bacterium]|jgi:hypothetical protein|nr:hypothetical protein [Elusimicrobiota bacterium]
MKLKIKKENFINFLKCTVFIAVLLFVIFSLEKLFFIKDYSPTWDKIYNKNSGQIDMLFCGSSVSFFAFDAELLSKMFDKEIWMLGIPQQNAQTLVENIKVLLKTKKPKIICLEAASFIIQDDVNGMFLANNIDGIRNWKDKMRVSIATLKAKNYLAILQLFRSPYKWKRWENFKERHYQHLYSDFNSYGSKSASLISKDTLLCKDWANVKLYDKSSIGYSVALISNKIPLLKKIAELAQKNEVEIWLIEPPEIQSENKKVESYFKTIRNTVKNLKYCDNLKNNILEIGLLPNDYNDRYHLNRRGQIKSTKYYADIISKRTGWEIKNKYPFYYDWENVEKIEENKWRYTMKNMQKDVMYKFALLGKNKNKTVAVQEFSSQNYFDCKIDIFQNPEYDIEAIMLPVGSEKTNYYSSKKLCFMKYGEINILT